MGELAHRVEHLADQLGVERRGRLVEQHQLRLHGQRAGDRHALLLAAGKRDRIGVALVAEADAVEQLLGALRASSRDTPLTRIGARITFSSAVMCGNRLKCWKTIPISARLRGDVALVELVQLVAGLAVADQLAVDRQPPELIFSRWLMQRRNVDLPEPEGPSRHMTSPALDLEVDALEDLEAPEALVDALGFDHRRSVTHDPRREPQPVARIAAAQRAEKPRPKRRSMKYWPTYRTLVIARYQMLATISSGIVW